MRQELKGHQHLVHFGVEYFRASWMANMEADDQNFNMEFIQGCCIRAMDDLQNFYKANFGHQLPLITPNPKHKVKTRIKSKNQK